MPAFKPGEKIQLSKEQLKADIWPSLWTKFNFQLITPLVMELKDGVLESPVRLSGQYLLNSSAICSQAWYGDASSSHKELEYYVKRMVCYI